MSTDDPIKASTPVKTNPLVRAAIGELERAKQNMEWHSQRPRPAKIEDTSSNAVSTGIGIIVVLFACIGVMILSGGGGF